MCCEEAGRSSPSESFTTSATQARSEFLRRGARCLRCGAFIWRGRKKKFPSPPVLATGRSENILLHNVQTPPPAPHAHTNTARGTKTHSVVQAHQTCARVFKNMHARMCSRTKHTECHGTKHALQVHEFDEKINTALSHTHRGPPLRMKHHNSSRPIGLSQGKHEASLGGPPHP